MTACRLDRKSHHSGLRLCMGSYMLGECNDASLGEWCECIYHMVANDVHQGSYGRPHDWEVPWVQESRRFQARGSKPQGLLGQFVAPSYMAQLFQAC